MRVAMCEYETVARLGVVRGQSVWLPALSGPGSDMAPGDVQALIEAGPEAWQRLATQAQAVPAQACVALERVRLLAPIPRPRKNVMCLGLNYADHAAESSRTRGQPLELPRHPVVFTKAVTSVSGPHDPIPYEPEVSSELDWEVELGVVIGLGGRRIPEDQALRHVFGYTVINDVSARDLQFRHKQFFLGKSLDGACPMGPWIVTADEVPDPQCLGLSCRVNGVIKQDSNTRQQIFSVAAVISVLSRGMTLEPGDIIATGTPAGVGFARTPPEFLRAGDVVECEVERIGRLRNPVSAGRG